MPIIREKLPATIFFWATSTKHRERTDPLAGTLALVLIVIRSRRFARRYSNDG